MPALARSLRQLSADLRDAGARWSAGENSFTDMSDEEKRLWLGYTPGPREPSLKVRALRAVRNLAAFERSLRAAPTAAPLPQTADLRDVGGRNFVTSVKRQGACGSCVAFGAIGAVEATLRRQADAPDYAIDLSEAHLFYCHARRQGRMCDNGWWVHDALDAVRDLGVTSEACYPYVSGDQDCTGLCADAGDHLTRISGWRALSSHEDMKRWLVSTGPLVTCFVAYGDFYAYRSGIYRQIAGTIVGGHCVLCVGFNDIERYWICKNSWGGSWGEGGYFRIEYGQVGIDAVMYGVEGVTFNMWYNGKQVTGLWVNNQDRNAYVYLDTVGWRKLGGNDNSSFLNMLSQLTFAKSGNRPVNVYEESGVITQVYVF